MCGIFGIWCGTKTDKIKLRNLAKECSSKILHRGPDNNGEWIDDTSEIIFQHKRLSIVDLHSSGNQPMKSYSERLIITFNGEIYNHQQLRKELNLSNNFHKSWKGTSDTETLIEAIDFWGLEKTLNKCSGMFAFSLWDRHKKELIICRDRYGEKPLYWGVLNPNVKFHQLVSSETRKPILIFSSEISSFQSIDGINLTLSEEAKSIYFSYGFITSPYSIYKNIFQLKPGSYIKICADKNGFFTENKIEKKDWWNLEKDYNYLSEKKYTSEKQATLDLQRVLEQVVKEHSQCDVSYGTFLSGGIDSSLITAILQRQKSFPINTFSVGFIDEGFNENQFNESYYAKAISSFLKTNHININLTFREVLESIPKVSSIYSEPFSDPSQIPTYLIAKEARNNGLKVVLSGDGGDEFFGGYKRHFYTPFIYKYSGILPQKLKENLQYIFSKIEFINKKINRQDYQKLLLSINEATNLERIYNSLLQIYPNKEEIGSFIDEKFIFRLNIGNTILDKILLADIKYYLSSNILTKVDRATMAVGLENRAPFLDKRVSEISWRIRNSLKVKNKIGKNNTKYIVRKVLNKYFPKQFFQRRKQGFNLPLDDWLRGPLSDWANEILFYDCGNDNGFLNKEKLICLWRDHLDNKYDHSRILWSILMWNSWLITNKK